MRNSTKDEKKGGGYKVFQNIKQLDIFGIRMEWTINGDPTFKTYIGAFFSIVCMAIVLAYSIREFIDMYTYANPDVKSSTVKINLSDPEIMYSYHPSSSNFNFAIGYTQKGYNLKIPPNVGYFEAKIVTRINKEDGGKVLKLVDCL